MKSVFLRLQLKKLVFAIFIAAAFYVILGNLYIPSRLIFSKPRTILSVNTASYVYGPDAGEDKYRVHNGKTFEELVESKFSNHEELKERIRSPDPNMLRHNDVTKNSSMIVMAVDGEKPLAFDVSQMEKIESYGNLSGSGDNLCPDINENSFLKGRIPQAILLITNLKEAEVRQHYPFLLPGGHWKPTKCQARYKVAVIIPFRDRQSHLTRLIDFLVPLLTKQFLDFRFIVTEQHGQNLFNKGRIMNAAFRMAEKLNVDCVIFHDVDMFPQDDRIPYGCPRGPRHLGAFVGSLGYQLWYKEIVGGVLAMNMDDYRTVNGYSNLFWAWGGEDDDMGSRILSLNYTIERPNSEFGRFSMLKHTKRRRVAPKIIYKLLESAGTRWKTDGLNVTSWKIVKMKVCPLYYHIYVSVGEPPSEWIEKL